MTTNEELAKKLKAMTDQAAAVGLLLSDYIAEAKQHLYRLNANAELTPVQCLEQMREYAVAALRGGDEFEMYDNESGHIRVTKRCDESGKRTVYIHGLNSWERDEPESYILERIAGACMFAVPKEPA